MLAGPPRPLALLPANLRDRISVRVPRRDRERQQATACWLWLGDYDRHDMPECECVDVGPRAKTAASHLVYACAFWVSVLDVPPLIRTCRDRMCVSPHHHRPKDHI